MKEFLSFIVLAIVGFIVGGSCGGNINENKFEDWEEEAIAGITHEVVIHWGNGAADSVITVREDLPYTINGCSNSTSYYNYIARYGGGGSEDLDFEYLNTEKITLPAEAVKNGFKLDGFYTSDHGGTLVINSAGYGLITLKNDIHLYACWSAIE